MFRLVEAPTAKQKLELAIELNEKLDAMCREYGLAPDAEILVLALYARTNRRERATLFPGGRMA